jgi:hypothetical protein
VKAAALFTHQGSRGQIATQPFTGERRAGRAIAAGLIAGADFRETGLILSKMLEPRQIAWIGGATIWGLPPQDAHDLCQAGIIDLFSDDAVEREAERQRRRWVGHCRGSRYRSPPLTREQERRGWALSFDRDDPRAALAAAWSAASVRDRRDLIRRATGRAM